mmetsp:Transcript_147414/g.257689  ORF Transcript_147414/g.257689 Transcript_147414/m.257689 type:complete len:240 (+) Transcript_147414:876-1595(+)
MARLVVFRTSSARSSSGWNCWAVARALHNCPSYTAPFSLGNRAALAASPLPCISCTGVPSRIWVAGTGSCMFNKWLGSASRVASRCSSWSVHCLSCLATAIRVSLIGLLPPEAKGLTLRLLASRGMCSCPGAWPRWLAPPCSSWSCSSRSTTWRLTRACSASRIASCSRALMCSSCDAVSSVLSFRTSESWTCTCCAHRSSEILSTLFRFLSSVCPRMASSRARPNSLVHLATVIFMTL